MNVFVVNNNLLGDGLMTLPAIESYKHKFPEHHITMITGKEEYNNLYTSIPYINKVIQSDQVENIKEKYKTATGSLTEFKDIKVCIFDCSLAFSWATRNKNIIKVNNQVRFISKHFIEAFCYQMKVLPITNHFEIFLGEDEISKGKEYISKHFSKPLLVVASLSSSCTSRSKKPGEENLPANKMLKAEIWQQVVNKLRDKFDFLFLGGRNEKKLDIDVPWLMGSPIREVASICRAAEAVVSIDTGTGHLASAVNANIVSIVAAVPNYLVGVGHTKGKYYLIDHSTENISTNPWGISSVTAEEIITGVLEICK